MSNYHLAESFSKTYEIHFLGDCFAIYCYNCYAMSRHFTNEMSFFLVRIIWLWQIDNLFTNLYLMKIILKGPNTLPFRFTLSCNFDIILPRNKIRLNCHWWGKKWKSFDGLRIDLIWGLILRIHIDKNKTF